MDIKYHENCYCNNFEYANEIVENLFVGNWNSAKKEWLSQNNIKYVISICQWNPKLIDVEHLYCNLNEDNPLKQLYQQMYEFLPSCLEFIDKALKLKQKILIHCICGQNRSASVAAAYLMISKKITWEKATDLIYSIRKIANPRYKESICRYVNDIKRI